MLSSQWWKQNKTKYFRFPLKKLKDNKKFESDTKEIWSVRLIFFPSRWLQVNVVGKEVQSWVKNQPQSRLLSSVWVPYNGRKRWGTFSRHVGSGGYRGLSMASINGAFKYMAWKSWRIPSTHPKVTSADHAAGSGQKDTWMFNGKPHVRLCRLKRPTQVGGNLGFQSDYPENPHQAQFGFKVSAASEARTAGGGKEIELTPEQVKAIE